MLRAHRAVQQIMNCTDVAPVTPAIRVIDVILNNDFKDAS